VADDKLVSSMRCSRSISLFEFGDPLLALWQPASG
jgi:hypothetical protein